MSLQEQLHREHKERQVRFDVAKHTPAAKGVETLIAALERRAADLDAKFSAMAADLSKQSVHLAEIVDEISSKLAGANKKIELIQSDELDRPTIIRIQKATARHYGVTRDDLMAARRNVDVAWPRHVAMYLCRMLTLKSFPIIGRHFAGRDHTSVMMAVRKIGNRLPSDPVLASDIEAIKLAILAGEDGS